HAIYAITGGEEVSRDQLTISHFEPWVKFAKENGFGIDFNPTCFSHPLSSDGLTLSHPNEDIRRFWINHCKASRKIALEMGKALGEPCVNNLWIPDGYKDTAVDTYGARQRLLASLNEIYEEKMPSEV
ncbi:MAG: L-rhamnose isomerase, partial [Planctomycetaceae bacterium]|nr:L-rhamnose isomerase [Planctomycetaceae bacterium]